MLSVLAAHVALLVLTGIVIGNTGPRRALGMATSALSIVPGWMLPGRPTLAAFVTLSGTLCFMRALDLARDRRTWPLARRIWHVVTPFDSRRIARKPPRLALAVFATSVAYASIATAGVVFAVRAEVLPAPWSTLARWLAGAVACYAAPDAVAALVTAIYAAFGVVVPTLHRNPILSRSVGEFWSERWNLSVHIWLRAHCFLPAARRFGVIAGGLAAFVGSALIHVGFTWPAVDARMAAWMGSFFLLQGVIVVLEPRLGVRSFSPAAAHAWTVVAVLVPSPLLVEPMLRIVLG